MITEIFSVYDSAVNAYLPPFFARSKGEAIRSFTEAASTRDHQFAKHALDYTLMSLGKFDDGSGTFETDLPVRIVGASEVGEYPFTEDTRVGDRPESSGTKTNGRKVPM